jgi:EAL domain-containing protein (putative c-di-GMP-specific phosphodiesterase class I)
MSEMASESCSGVNNGTVRLYPRPTVGRSIDGRARVAQASDGRWQQGERHQMPRTAIDTAMGEDLAVFGELEIALHQAIRELARLDREGAHIAGDFGTGFSSLSYLRMLPASELKIDRSFVANLLTDHRDEVIVRSTIDLGHNLGLRVAAEGVEDDATRERLRELGCDLAQGFGIARPLPLSRFVAWLTTSGNQVARARIEGAWRPLSSPLDV